MKQQHELLLQNPVFHKGLNITVRNGEKWMKANIDDELLIKETGSDQLIAIGTLAGKMFLPVSLIPESLLHHEHDPSCRTLSGLLAEMKRIYSGFSEDSLVTVLLFYL